MKIERPATPAPAPAAHSNARNSRLQYVLESRLSALEEELAHAQPHEKAALHSRLRSLRTTIARAKGRHTKEQWAAIVAETAGICVRCGFQHDLAVEWPYKGFIIPPHIGGSADISNVMPLCRSCISAKKDEQIDWLAVFRENGRVPNYDDALPEGA